MQSETTNGTTRMRMPDGALVQYGLEHTRVADGSCLDLVERIS